MQIDSSEVPGTWYSDISLSEHGRQQEPLHYLLCVVEYEVSW